MERVVNMSAKILVTAGPVHAYLDPVKIVTNRFKGGMMLGIARDLLSKKACDVTVLCSKSVSDAGAYVGDGRVVHHDGFGDYMAKVLEMAKDFDAVVLGAAVANLIPAKPWKDKFPSHNYKPGDVVDIPFMIAPRVIDQVKERMKPGAHLFGFKLLSGQSFDELIRAAYGVLTESRATVVFANDPLLGLDKKFVVTKERAVVPVSLDGMSGFIKAIMDDEYYRSVDVPASLEDMSVAWANVEKALDHYRDHFVTVENGLVFGTVAYRFGKTGFVTTARGKDETKQLAVVTGVDHKRKLVSVLAQKGVRVKATLNAPLLSRIFELNPDVHGILHFHYQEAGLPTRGWAPPGTIRDSCWRDVSMPFNVEGHGCFMFVDKNGKVAPS